MDAMLESRIRRLERKIMALSGLCGFLVIAITFLFFKSPAQRVRAAEATTIPQILHVRGLVIDDAQGRARILLGAPFPKSPDRIRQDAATTGMLILDEKGHDRFFVGQAMNPQINGKVSPHFHRIGSAYGLTIFDPEGNERGGMAFLSNGGTLNRAVIALDRHNGDAWGAMVDDKTGFAGTADIYASKNIGGGANGIVIGTQDGKAFITLKDVDGRARSKFVLGPNGVPSFRLFDKNGKASPDLLNAKAKEFSGGR